MDNNELWNKMERLAQKNTALLTNNMEFTRLVKEAYDEDLDIWIACEYKKGNDKQAFQGCIGLDAVHRFLICYTSEKRAQKGFGNLLYDRAKMRDILNNMFNKESLIGLAFNPGKDAMVLVLKESLKYMMPGSKPKPPHFRDTLYEEEKIKRRYTLKVFPKGWGREAYRVLEISGRDTLEQLCTAILETFDFQDEHLYEFCMDNKVNSLCTYQSSPQWGEPSVQIMIDKLGLTEGQKFLLHYDFGDDWIFSIRVQKIAEEKQYEKPAVIKSKGEVEQYPDWE